MAEVTTRNDPLERARGEIARDPEAAPRLAALARRVGLSATHLTRAFRARFGVSPRQYAEALRLARFKSGLREGEDVTQAVHAAGFGSPSRVYENVSRRIGMTPGEYRRGGAGLEIRYTVVATTLGRMLVAVTARGICAVSLGDDEGTLERALRAEFPTASLSRIDAGADEWISSVVARVTGQSEGARGSLPADVDATAFQWRVWEELMRIPPGETRSYSAIAAAIGKPRAARAVARACATNRLALIVPCHRVVREDGTLGGYRWGVACKRAILQREAASAAVRAPPTPPPATKRAAK